MSRFVRSLCTVMAIVIAMSIPVSATEDVLPRSSNYFAAGSAFLWKTSSTTFEVWFDITSVDTMDELGVSKIVVQRSLDGTNWVNMVTYTKESYPHLIKRNTVSHGDCVTYSGTPGCYYRAYVTYYAKNSTGSGYSYKYTSVMQL